ncbi:hypothetical protein ED28_10840 [[Pantoea] beijingensis]|uniref:Uncharacterized protein n=1 Tax=[Pantoea] beijingensis TaxID=1324864 RepID=A0A443ID36_9GAMM|nr:hypothetical protein ED28_10840 [[Pantoea] beijingensis]
MWFKANDRGSNKRYIVSDFGNTLLLRYRFGRRYSMYGKLLPLSCYPFCIFGSAMRCFVIIRCAQYRLIN